MSREEEFDKMMASLFEMARYISVYENTPRRYQTQNLYMTEVHAISLIAHREGLNLTQLAKLTNRTKQMEQRIYQTFLERMPAFSSQDFHRCFEILEGIKQAASSRWNKK